MSIDSVNHDLMRSSFDIGIEEFDEAPPSHGSAASPATSRPGDPMEAVFEVPVKVKAVLGGARVQVGELIRMRAGSVVELDRRVGEPVDVFVNDRLIARGELVLIEGSLGITLTEIVKQDR
ncbi:MAG TPA: flagellar motor switch protein FliN [Sphingomonas sp.]|nr:flagellar motor switch protein FliN [Sphingomonas sp.]